MNACVPALDLTAALMAGWATVAVALVVAALVHTFGPPGRGR